MSKNNNFGNTDLLLMGLLKDEDLYGYLITQRLAEQSNHYFEMKEGTLYPLLHQLEERGYLESYKKIAESGKERKYYHLTGSGRKYFEARVENWNQYYSAVKGILGGCDG